MKRNKYSYNKIVDLCIKQNWLITKREKLDELIDFCSHRENKDLIFSLLERFNYLTDVSYSLILDSISDFIVLDSGFSEGTTQLLSMTNDDDSDSSQKILYHIMTPIYKKGWHAVKTVNRFGKSVKNFNEGKTQILMIDEFIGSGKTLGNRIDRLNKNIPDKFELKCCFVAGIKETIDTFTKDGISIYCPLQLEKGISGFFKGDDLIKAENSMIELEAKLAEIINDKELKTYSFGYGKAEALYTMEGCHGNTPNSVFPIFWWCKDTNNKERNTLLTRYEIGF